MSTPESYEVVRTRARIINAISNGQNIGNPAAFDDTPDIASLKGGWVAEGASGSYEKAAFKLLTLRFMKLMLTYYKEWT